MTFLDQDSTVVGIHREYNIGRLRYIVDLHKVDVRYKEGVCEVRLLNMVIAFAEVQIDCDQMKITEAHGLISHSIMRHIEEAFEIATDSWPV